MKRVTIGVLCVILSACIEQTPPNDELTPTLQLVENQRVIAGETIQFNVNSGSVSTAEFSSDGAIGPGKNPYAQSTPAVFDPSAATFTWTPSDSEAGEYSVQFTLVYPDEPELTVTETITITVLAAHEYGGELFAQHCAGCHGEDATGGTARAVLRATAADIENAVSSITAMQLLGTALSAKDNQYIAQHLEYLLAEARAHTGVDLTLGCVQCHNGFNATGKSAVHLSTTDRCGVCHQVAVWEPVWLLGYMHNDLITPMDCSICHQPRSSP